MCDDSEALFGEPVVLWQLRNFVTIFFFWSIILLYLIYVFVYLLFSFHLLRNLFIIHFSV